MLNKHFDWFWFKTLNCLQKPAKGTFFIGFATQIHNESTLYFVIPTLSFPRAQIIKLWYHLICIPVYVSVCKQGKLFINLSVSDLFTDIIPSTCKVTISFCFWKKKNIFLMLIFAHLSNLMGWKIYWRPMFIFQKILVFDISLSLGVPL